MSHVSRWYRLSAAVIAMIMIGNLQYAWTLFADPLRADKHWKLSDVQLGFGIFIAVMTWAMPFVGGFIDRMGPRLFMSVAGVLCAVGWGSLGHTRTLPEFYALYAVAGLGNAFVYCCSTALGLKWFPDKRGVASGLIAAGYGSGAAFFNPIFGSMIGTVGFKDTFTWSGVFLGVLIICAGQLLRYPPEGFISVPPTKASTVNRRQSEQFNSWEMLKTPQFYMLYAMMLAVSIGGLLATANAKQVGTNFKVGAAAITLALSLNPLGNGASRLGWGWISDYLGRERTMVLAFFLQAVFLCGVVTLGRMGDAWFVATMALVFLTWGELYVLFPAVLTDLFGGKNAASNYSFLYSTKGVAALFGSALAARMFETTGTWNYAFYGSAMLALCSALGAIVVMKMPLPKRQALLAAEAVRAEGAA